MAQASKLMIAGMVAGAAVLCDCDPAKGQETGGRRGAQGAIPVVDIKATCRTAAGVSGSIPTKESAEACLRSEQDARDQIAKQWAQFNATDRERCINPKVYLPSYVEWLTCLEMERDVRKMKQQPTTPQR